MIEIEEKINLILKKIFWIKNKMRNYQDIALLLFFYFQQRNRSRNKF